MVTFATPYKRAIDVEMLTKDYGQRLKVIETYYGSRYRQRIHVIYIRINKPLINIKHANLQFEVIC